MHIAHEKGWSLQQVGELTVAEFDLWVAFYARHDPGFREDRRVFKVVSAIAASVGVKVSLADVFPWLAELDEEARRHAPATKVSEAELKRKMLAYAGGMRV